jgi:hypothetical protein
MRLYFKSNFEKVKTYNISTALYISEFQMCQSEKNFQGNAIYLTNKSCNMRRKFASLLISMEISLFYSNSPDVVQSMCYTAEASEAASQQSGIYCLPGYSNGTIGAVLILLPLTSPGGHVTAGN